MTYKHIRYGLFIIIMIIMLTAPDLIVDPLTNIFHFIYESLLHLAHLSFEAIEELLDTLVERLFETEVHETQTIVFYLMILLAGIPAYILWRLLPWLKGKLIAIVLKNKNHFLTYWSSLSLLEKIKVSVITIISAYLGSFLFF